MRVNWTRQCVFFTIIGIILYLAWDSSIDLTMRSMSLGQPDLWMFFMIFVIFGYPFTEWSIAMYLFYQAQREKAPVCATTFNRVPLYNTDPFDITKPPENYAKLWDGDEDAPSEPLDEYSVWVGQGVIDLRLRISADTAQIVIAPSDLTMHHADMVDVLAHCESYMGLPRSLELPEWAITYCIENVPGYVPYGTEIIFGDAPDDSAVLAWDERGGRGIWTRAVRGSPVDYISRLIYLEDEIKNRTVENIQAARDLDALRKRKLARKREAKSAPHQTQQPQQQQGNTGGSGQ